MKKKLRARQETLAEVLAILGYRNAFTRTFEQRKDWRRQQFHLIVRQKHKESLTLQLHMDFRSEYPPFHRAVQIGKALDHEFSKILRAYKTRVTK